MRTAGNTWVAVGVAWFAPAMAAILTYGGFVCEARELVEMSERLGDGWELRSVRTTDGPEETTYLVKKTTVMMDFPNGGPPAEIKTPPDAEGLENIEDDDPAALQESRSGPVAVHFEYDVVHSPSYQVPVLYFTATYQSGKLVPLSDIWKFMSPAHVRKDSEMEWGTVTQQEHPILCRPFYHIHPCHTATVMGTTLQAHGNETDEHENGMVTSGLSDKKPYLLSWLAMYGPTVGLQMSLNYLHLHSKS